MHFIINKETLNEALSHVSKAVSSKTVNPILAGIKFAVENEEIIITGSDSEITIQTILSANNEQIEKIKIIETGKIILPKYIVEITKKLPEEDIEFLIKDNFTVIIKSGASEFLLNGFDAEDYPNLPYINPEQFFSIESDLLKSMIRQTIFAVSTVENRQILNGVLWQLENDSLKFVATDSHRLAIRKATTSNNTNLSFSNVVVPSKSLNELSKILDGANREVQVTIEANQILFRIDDIILLSRLLEGTYPEISRIIPQTTKTQITLQTKELLAAIERASLIAKDSKNNIIKFMTLDGERIEISSHSTELGKVTENLFNCKINGDSIKISFNAKYAIDALRSIDSSEILIEFTGALSPFVVKPLDHDKTLHLIVPIRTI